MPLTDNIGRDAIVARSKTLNHGYCLLSSGDVNSKFESRNPKQFQNPKKNLQTGNRNVFPVILFWILALGNSDLFRISRFGFRISIGRTMVTRTLIVAWSVLARGAAFSVMGALAILLSA